MRRTWVVVGSRAGARIFEHTGAEHPLSLVREFDHPNGRKRSSEIDTDRSGSAFSSAGTGGGHPMNTSENAHDHTARTFAKELAGALRQARIEHRFHGLVLVAEPGFLGMLRGALDKPTAEFVTDTLDKDLANVPVHELDRHLTKVVGAIGNQRGS